jgi:hypothetical protein
MSDLGSDYLTLSTKGSIAVMLAGGTSPWHACSDWGRLSGGTDRGAAAVGHGGGARQGRAGTVQRGTQDSEQARGTSKHTNKHKGTNSHTKQNTNIH